MKRAKKRYTIEIVESGKISTRQIYIPKLFVSDVENLIRNKLVEIDSKHSKVLAKYLKSLNHVVDLYFARDGRRRKSFIILKGNASIKGNRIIIEK